MKIFLLSDANSIHTLRWVKSLSSRNCKIKLFSLFKPNNVSIKQYDKLNIKVISLDLSSQIKNLREPNIGKIRYLQAIPLLKKTIKNFNPDILHAHYSSSYGILAFLVGFKPFVLSVWGSDISYFPYKNIFNKWITSLVIKNATKICSTSHAMKNIIQNEYKRFDVNVISFGVDTNIFKPTKNKSKIFNVGTIKSIESHNGIDCIIDAANIVINEYKKNIDFTIVGEGSLKRKMEEKTKKINLENKIKFTGYISHEKLPKYFNDLSIFLAPSERESFGVSVLEAASCEIPAITSNIGGLKEVNSNNETGIIIDSINPEKLAKAIVFLHSNKDLRLKLGKNARRRVLKNYDWEHSVDVMMGVYSAFNEAFE